MLLLPLFQALALASTALAQPNPILCPPDSTLGVSFQNLTISTAPEDLYIHLGDFYSPSWQHLLSDRTLTFAPPHRTFTIASQSITETLSRNHTTASAFHVRYNLTSGPFRPTPSVLILAYDVSVTALLRICVHGVWSHVVWKTVVCVAGATADPGVSWFETRNAGVVQRLFASVAEGWVVEGAGGGMEEEARCSGANYTSVQQGEKEQEQEQEQEQEDKEQEEEVGGKAISMLDGENVAGRAQVRGLIVLVGVLLWWEGV